MTTDASILSYVLVTPARNEETHIRGLIETILQQTVHPMRWVIVNDGSTDRTGDIVKEYLPTNQWIELLELPSHRDRSFAAKAHCFQAGYERVVHLSYDVVGNLDADVTFDSDYIEFLLRKFAADLSLGVAGTVFVEKGYNSATDSFEGQIHVAGGCQMFRRACFDQVGGYVPTKIGVDWIAVTTARMLGWKTKSFREKAFIHHRALGTAGRSRLAASRLYGEKDYRLGWHPLYEALRILFQLRRDPLVGLNIAAGYFGASLRGIDRSVSPELMRFHRAEQIAKLKTIFMSVVTFTPVDNFRILR